MSKAILKADLEGTATLALNANHANAADTATNATNATKAKTANNALALNGKSLADILASGATKAVKLEENSATGAFKVRCVVVGH